jgi:hypothetical protein
LIGAGNIHTLRSRRRPAILHCSPNGTQPPRRYHSSSRPRKSGNDSDDHAIAGQYNMRPDIDMLAQCRDIKMDAPAARWARYQDAAAVSGTVQRRTTRIVPSMHLKCRDLPANQTANPLLPTFSLLPQATHMTSGRRYIYNLHTYSPCRFLRRARRSILLPAGCVRKFVKMKP